MKKIGLFYAKEAKKTAEVAKKIQNELGSSVEVIPVEDAWQDDFMAHDCLIVGASTWFDGELPTYWDELVPELQTLDLKGKKVAVFGLGDQVKYPDNFADGVGILADIFKADGASLVGLTSTEGYTFDHSKALCGGKWSGLVLDVDNQNDLTDKRIKEWCKQLREEFDI